MLDLNLNGTWEMRRVGEDSWLSAIVPGSVYADLLQAGQMEDPFFRENEYEALELSGFDYEYRRNFTVDAVLLSQDLVVLSCEGLDTLANVSLNGVSVLEADNMHRTWEVPVKHLLREGENEVNIHFKSPLEFVRRMHRERPLLNSNDAVEGISHLRKAHCMFGWDWGPKLPDMGIWRNILLKGFTRARLKDVYLTQRHHEGKVLVNARIRVARFGPGSLEACVEISCPDGQTLTTSAALPEGELNLQVTIDDPQLWWPNHLGEQPLYRVGIVLKSEGKELDHEEQRIGLRTLSVRREEDQWGETFEFIVNGVDFFSMGADYIPEDNILARCSRERTEKLIKSCVEANFNSIRVWGGAYYPEDWFYDLCDEYGLVVWQDLMFACGVYELTDGFTETVRHEIADNMKRLRHHASLGLWCGNNEQEWAWVEWGWSKTCEPKLKADYTILFEHILPGIAREVDPETTYWLASPSSSGSFDNPNDENRGDMHFWGVWHGLLPFTDYRKLYPRYMSEFGLQSYPNLKTLAGVTLPEDQNIFSPVMESHQKNVGGNGKILYYISENYRYPKDFESLLFASQLIQAEGLRYGVEHWRRNRGRCMGAIYWQLNDCWPVASWASVDSEGRWKALHYTAKRFFSPMMASACEEGTKVSLHVSNEQRSAVQGQLVWFLRDNASKLICEGSAAVSLEAMSTMEAAALDFGAELPTKERQRACYLEYAFRVSDETVSGGTVLFVKAKHFSFLDPKLTWEVTETVESFDVILTSQAFAKFVGLDLRTEDAIFSDNYFDLSAGMEKRITFAKNRMSRPMKLEEVRAELVVRSLYDTW